MSSFTDADIAAAVSAESVNLAPLFEFDLASGFVRFGGTNIPFTDANGIEWAAGDGVVVSYDDINYSGNVEADKRTYYMSVQGKENLALALMSQESEYRWRKKTQYLQIFANNGTLTPIGEPLFLHRGYMDVVTFSAGGDASLALDVENELIRKNNSTSGYYTDQDQRSRYPDDEALVHVKRLALGEVASWPPNA